MFSRQEAKQIRQQFWTAFGIYMRQHTSTRGPEIKWINYRTGVKDIYFRLEADQKGAMVSIDLQHKDREIRSLIFDQWEALRTLLHNHTTKAWTWNRSYYLPTGKEISRIFHQQTGLNIFDQNDWGDLFRYFAGQLVALDELWEDAISIFQDLEG